MLLSLLENYFRYAICLLYNLFLGSTTEGENEMASDSGDHDSIVTSTPLKSSSTPEKQKVRRVLPTIHGGTARTTEKSNENEEMRQLNEMISNVDSENNELKARISEYSNTTDDSENEARESHENAPGGEDQLSATESEADRHVSLNADEEMTEEHSRDANESKQHLKEMLDDLARPYARKLTTDSNPESIASQQSVSF